MYLFEFTINNKVWYFNNTTQAFGQYEPLAVSIDKLDNDINKKEIKIKVPYNKEPFNKINTELIDMIQKVTIKNESGRQLYTGIITTIETEYATGIATITTGDMLKILTGGKFPTQYYSKKCRFQLGDVNCGLTHLKILVNVFSIVSGNKIQINQSVPDLESFKDGYIIIPNQPNRMIVDVDVDNNIITLNRNLASPDIGSSGFYLHKGCDKTYTTCKVKFDNQRNFGGFLGIPENNPVTGSI